MPLPISRAYLLRNLKQFWTDKLKPVNTLTGTDANFPLSAVQGKVLNDSLTQEITDRTTAVSNLNTKITNTLKNYVTLDEKGTANGIAELDENAIIDVSQLPDTLMNIRGYADTSSTLPTNPLNGDIYICSEAGTIFNIKNCNVNDRLLYINSTWTNLPSGKVQSVNTKTGNVVLTANTTISETGLIKATSSSIQPVITNNITQPEFSATATKGDVTLTRTKDVDVQITGSASDISIKLTQNVGVSSIATGGEITSTASGGNLSFTHSVSNKVLTLTATMTQPSITSVITTEPTIENIVTQPVISGSAGSLDIKVDSITQPEFSTSVTQPTISINRITDVGVVSTNSSITPEIDISDTKVYTAETTLS